MVFVERMKRTPIRIVLTPVHARDDFQQPKSGSVRTRGMKDERGIQLATRNSKLSKQRAATNLVKQLERCGPAGGANYEEARGAESPAVAPLIDEAGELVAILTASANTARRRADAST